MQRNSGINQLQASSLAIFMGGYDHLVSIDGQHRFCVVRKYVLEMIWSVASVGEEVTHMARQLSTVSSVQCATKGPLGATEEH